MGTITNQINTAVYSTAIAVRIKEHCLTDIKQLFYLIQVVILVILYGRHLKSLEVYQEHSVTCNILPQELSTIFYILY
jgi:hypothetical protein